jgi:hypothetical protein
MSKGGGDVTVKKYFVNMHHVLCVTPIDYIKQIRFDKKDVFVVDPLTNHTPDETPYKWVEGVIYVRRPGLFGGDNKEGGIKGKFLVRFGFPGQAAYTVLQKRFGHANIPSYAGVVSVVMKNFYIGLNYYLKPMSYIVVRLRNTSEAGVLNTSPYIEPLPGQMNGVLIAKDLLTNTYYGLGIPSSRIGASFDTVASAAFNLHYGFSFHFNEGKSIDELLKTICAHLNAVIYVDRHTNKYEIKLIKNDYNVGTLPVYNKTNTIRLTNLKQPLIGELFSKVTIKFTNSKTFEPASVSRENAGLSSIQGGTNEKTIEFKGIQYQELAEHVAQRELDEVSSPTWSGEIEVTTLSYLDSTVTKELNLGDAFIIDKEVNPYIDRDLICRVAALDLGTVKNNVITISFVEDIFYTPVIGKGFGSTEGAGHDFEEHIIPPIPVINAIYTEVPYYLMAKSRGDAEAQKIDPNTSFAVMAAASPQDSSIDAGIWVNGIDTGAKLNFCFHGKLTSNIDKLTTVIEIINYTDPESVVVGEFIQIDNEFLRIDVINSLPLDDTSDTDESVIVPMIANITVSRGCLDTVPESHLLNADCYAWQSLNGFDKTQFTLFETINIALTPETPFGELPFTSATNVPLTFAGRMHKPYPPANVKINDTYWPNTVEILPPATTVVLETIFELDLTSGFTDISPIPKSINILGSPFVDTVIFDTTPSSLGLPGFSSLSLNFNTDLDIVGEFEISFSIYHPAAQAENAYLFNYNSDPFNVLSIYVQATTQNLIVSTPAGTITGTAIPFITWTAIKVTRVAGVVELFINTVSAGTIAMTNSFKTLVNLVFIGSADTFLQNFIGNIDNFKIKAEKIDYLPVSFVERNRFTQTVSLIDFYFGTLTKEPDVLYHAVLKERITGTTLTEYHNFTTTNLNIYTSFKGDVILTLFSSNANGNSLQSVTHNFNLT